MKEFKHIKKVGFELEGGWEEERFDAIEEEGMMKGDGSVEVDDTLAGEIATRPFEDLTKAWKFTEKYYPDEVNRSCGLHVHISVSDMHYAILMERDFYKEFLRWGHWIGTKFKKRLPATYMSRLKGENSFCQAKFIPERQIDDNGDRYTQLNYCYDHHKTIENRMFPGCKSPRTAFFLITQYLIFVNNYLERTKVKCKKHKMDVVCEIPEIKKKIKGEKICA